MTGLPAHETPASISSAAESWQSQQGAFRRFLATREDALLGKSTDYEVAEKLNGGAEGRA